MVATLCVQMDGMKRRVLLVCSTAESLGSLSIMSIHLKVSDVSSKYVTIIHCTNASHSLGHPCLVSLLLVPSLYAQFVYFEAF